MDPTAVNSLIHITEDRNYFTSNALKITMKTYASGLAAVNGRLNNEADIATAAEFYLGRFLDLNGMNARQVILVDVRSPHAVDALVKGDVDAVVAWQPNVKAMEDRLGNGIVTPPNRRSFQPPFSNP